MFNDKEHAINTHRKNIRELKTKMAVLEKELQSEVRLLTYITSPVLNAPATP